VKSSINVWVGLALVAAAVLVWIVAKPNAETLSEVHLVPLAEASHSPGHDVSLADLRGRVVLLNFWGTWCPPCREEFPEIVTLAQKLKDRPQFRLLAVSCERDDETLDAVRNETREFLQDMHSWVPTYADPDFYTRRNVAMALDDNQFAYPTTIVLDQAGIIRGVWTGYAEGFATEMEKLVGELLKQPAR